jgi:hypothetical protein
MRAPGCRILSAFGPIALVWLLAACEGGEGVPEGKLAVVGNEVLGPEDVAKVQHQLGTYAQRRFRGPEGSRNLLEALIEAELLAQEAIANGLGDDPRVRWALLEEVALLYLSAELERRVPRESVARNVASLRAYYDQHPEEFRVPEKRVAKGVVFSSMVEALPALERLRAGEVTLEDLGQVLRTPAMARDDVAHPGFHVYLFDGSLAEGDLLPQPVAIGETLLVGRLHEIQPAHLEDFGDPSVQERLVSAARRPLLDAAQAELLAELAERFPVQALE